MILHREDNKQDAIVPLSFLISKHLSFIFSIALLFSLEVNVIVFVLFSEVLFIVLVYGSNTFLYSHEKFVYLISLVIVFLPLDFVVKLTLLTFLNLPYF